MQKKGKRKSFGTNRRKIEGIPGLDPDNFVRACDDLINLCETVKDQNETNQQLLRNFIKIRLVSIVEFHLKGFISDLIDSQNLNPNDVLEEDSISIDLDVLQNFKNETITKGKIIVAHLDKVNPGTVYSIMSRINKLDSFKWIDKILNFESGDAFNFFNTLNMERNNLTHNLTDVTESTKTLGSKIHTMQTMIFSLFICTNCNIDMLDKHLPESVLEQEYGSRLKKLGLNQKQFKDITSKFRKEYKPFSKRY